MNTPMRKGEGSSATGLGIDLFPADTLEPRSDVASYNSTLLSATLPSPFEAASSSSSPSLPIIDRPTLECKGTPSSLPDVYVPDKLPKHPESSGKVSRLAADINLDWRRSEINAVLGDANSRLKSGVKLLPQGPGERKGLALEKTRRRSRVDLDISLKNDICVQGGHLQGLIKIHVRKHSKKCHPILISADKLSIIGFESNASERERYVFYDSSAALSDVASNLEVLYDSEPDSEGFTRPKEGIHSLPFSFYISASIENGTPKGHTTTLSGVSVRYIAMVSLRIKDPVSGKKSMAHFYRGCSIWPRLNPSVLLAPTSRPLQVTVSEGLVYLTASLHRLHWVAGQLCYVRFEVVNNSKKFLRSLSLELIQSTTTFKHKDQDDRVDVGVDIRSSTIKKQTAQSSLVMGEGGTRGHASAKGWWSGIAAGDMQTFSHSILLPADALSISRGKLLEISYAIHVTVSMSTFLSPDVHVSLPLDIINFLSIDPPPEQITETGIKKVPCGAIPTSISTYEAIDDDASSELDGDYTSDEDETDSLGNLSVHEDTGKAVRQIILSATMDAENAPRFADLYFSSAEHNSDPVIGSKSPCESSTEKILPAMPLSASNFISRVEEKNTKRIADLLGSRESAQAAEPFPGKDNAHTSLHVSKGQQDQDVSIEGRFPSGLSGNRVAELSSFKSRAAKSCSSDECQPALSRLRSGTVQFDHTTLLAARFRLKPVGGAVEPSVETCSIDENGMNNSQPTQDSISLASPKNGVGQFSAHRDFSVGDIIDAYIRPSSPTVLQTQRLSASFETADDQTPPFTQSLEEYKLVKGNLRTTLAAPIRRLSVDLMLHAAPAAGSVRDKIRELEELAAKAGADA